MKLSRLPLPSERFRLRLFRNMYTKLYPPGLNESEAEKPLGAYRSFNALFTRGIKPEHRPIPDGPASILSPCDGRVQDVGTIKAGLLFTLKGISYSLASLLPNIDIRPYEGGQFLIAFLSPIDCHRVFSPQDGFLEEIIHVPGSRLLVHPPFQRPEFPVYTLNERVIFRFSTPVGPTLAIMVAGWGVGHITLPFAPEVRLNSRRTKSHTMEPPRSIKRGDWLATFELGSTVMIITASSSRASALVAPNDEVRYGQPVLKLN